MLCLGPQGTTSVLLHHSNSRGEEMQHRDSTTALSLQNTRQPLSVSAAQRRPHAASWSSRSAAPVSCRAQQHECTFMAVMSMTCHFMRGRARRFRRSMAVTTDFTKSILVMSSMPSSYLQPHESCIRQTSDEHLSIRPVFQSYHGALRSIRFAVLSKESTSCRQSTCRLYSANRH